MFSRLGELIVKRSTLIVIAAGLLVVVAGLLGVGVFGILAGGGTSDPNSESARAMELLENEFDAGTSNVVLLVTATSGSVDTDAETQAALEIVEQLGSVEGLVDIGSYWQLGSPSSLRSADGSSALIFAHAVGDAEASETTARTIVDNFTSDDGTLQVEVGGSSTIFAGIDDTVEEDLVSAELIAFPLTLLLLVFVFRGVIAALLPIAVGASAVFGALFVLWLIALVTDVSAFSINLVTALGLGLAIDYSLLIVSRFREELERQETVEAATIRTVETAGRTVAFSGLTVAVSLVSLVLFPLYFLRSFAYAGVGVLLVAVLTSVVALPAALHLIGPNINRLRLPGSHASGSESPAWGRVATAVLRRPILVAVAVVALLTFAGLPFLGVTFGSSDERVLPSDHAARVATQRIQEQFASDEAASFPVVIPESVDQADLDKFASMVSTVENIQRVDTSNGIWAGGERVAVADDSAARYVADAGTWMNVVPSVAAMSSEAETAVEAIRAINTDFDNAVGGRTADLIDTKAAILRIVPWAGAWIACATFILLFLMFGSFLVPLKAIILNSLSLTATFGGMVWVFQDGNLAGLLDFTPTGFIDVSMPILMLAIAFGLSMDYEVFLLSRMKEEYERTGDNEAAIVAGLSKTGGTVTAAALVLSITFFALATGGITFIKLFGLGLGVAVLVDAFIVRATLVPALMAIAGPANWWAPEWAKRIHDRFGIDESSG